MSQIFQKVGLIKDTKYMSFIKTQQQNIFFHSFPMKKQPTMAPDNLCD